MDVKIEYQSLLEKVDQFETDAMDAKKTLWDDMVNFQLETVKPFVHEAQSVKIADDVRKSIRLFFEIGEHDETLEPWINEDSRKTVFDGIRAALDQCYQHIIKKQSEWNEYMSQFPPDAEFE